MNWLEEERWKNSYVQPKNKTMKKQKNLGIGVALGVAIGTAIGVATNNLGMWLAIGVAIGAGIGTAYVAKNKNDKDQG